MRVADKVIVVTGGGNGIGRGLVLELLRRGARVAACDVREEALRDTAGLAGAGERLSTHVIDITDRVAVEALPRSVIAAHGAVDGLVNNAGVIQPFVRFHELGYDAIERMIDVNLYGTVHMSKAFLPHLLGRPVAHLVNVSSMGGFLPVPGQTMYGAAKAAVKLLTEGLYGELLESNVRVSVVMPGAIATDIAKNSKVELDMARESMRRWLPTPADAARVIVDGMESDRLHILVGVDAKMLFLASRAAPRRAMRLIQKQMKALLRT